MELFFCVVNREIFVMYTPIFAIFFLSKYVRVLVNDAKFEYEHFEVFPKVVENSFPRKFGATFLYYTQLPFTKIRIGAN